MTRDMVRCVDWTYLDPKHDMLIFRTNLEYLEILLGFSTDEFSDPEKTNENPLRITEVTEKGNENEPKAQEPKEELILADTNLCTNV